MKKKALLTSMALLLVAVICLATATYAWFSESKVVTASGMKVTASVSGSSLLIDTKTVSKTSTSSVAFTSARRTLQPSTYDSTLTNAPKLKYITNNGAVDPDTGTIETPSWDYVTLNSTSSPYYVDYKVYIASAGAALENKDLDCTVTINTPNENGITNNTMNAITIQAFDKDGVLLATFTPSHTTETFYGSNIGSVGQNADLEITFRVFLDGAAEESTGINYVRSAGADTGDLDISVSFEIPAPPVVGP
jgi:hypothetical protein